MPKPVTFAGEFSPNNPIELLLFIEQLLELPELPEDLIFSENVGSDDPHELRINIDQEFRICLAKFLYLLFVLPRGPHRLADTFPDVVTMPLFRQTYERLLVEEEATLRRELLNQMIAELANNVHFWQRRELLSILLRLSTGELHENVSREHLLR